MKKDDISIRCVRIHQLRQELKEGLSWCSGRNVRHLGTSVIEVELNNGMRGWGDGWVDVERLRQQPELVVGRTPFEAEVIFQNLLVSHRRTRGSGALDIALWDLQGKLLNKRVADILAPVRRDRIMAYASVGYMKESWKDPVQGVVNDVQRYVNQGFKVVKIKTGYGREFDIRLINAVRNAIGPEIKLCVDSGSPGVYDSGTAVGLGRQLEQFDLEFWEEPVEQYDFEGYRRLKQVLRIPLAGGEGLPVADLLEHFIAGHLVDIVQPDIDMYGFTAGKWVLNACWTHRVRLIPHTWAHTPIRIAATMHWLACIRHEHGSYINPPSPLLELHPPHESVCWDLTEEGFAVDPADGCIPLPNGPGLGITVKPEKLAPIRFEKIEIA